ncbi:MAG: hypothetical protein AUJ07_08725 [Crenarchaeota archaeon 13_1_40CM_3_53_5]|nr:MAG: hypothetical protein AUJ07_08725 [Crenarchaeota archaeon 13_1_40CM_3_53_5]
MKQALVFLLLLGSILGSLHVPNKLVLSEAHAVSQPLISSSTVYAWHLINPQSSNRIPLTKSVDYLFYPDGRVNYVNSNGGNMTLLPLSAKWGSLPANVTLPFTGFQYNSTTVEYSLSYKFLSNNLTLNVIFSRMPQDNFNLDVRFTGTLSALGALALSFHGTGARRSDSTTIHFGSVGFDWSDTVALNVTSWPNGVQWSNLTSFNIDPTTIGSTTAALPVPLGFMRGVFASSTGIIFVEYCDGTNDQYASSTDGGVTWSATQLVAGCTNGDNNSWWYDGGFVYFVSVESAACGQANYQACYKVGTVSGTTITFNSFQAVSVGYNIQLNPGWDTAIITVDSKGQIWIDVSDYLAHKSGIANCACTGQQTWVNATSFPTVKTGTGASTIVPLTAGKVALVYPDSSPGPAINIQSWSGTVWNTVAGSVETTNNNLAFSAVAVQDNILATFSSATTLYSATYHYVSNSLDASTQIIGSFEYPALTYDLANQRFYLFYIDTNNIYYTSYGTGWSDIKLWISGETILRPVELNTAYNVPNTAPFLSGQDTAPLFWSSGNSPYNLRYQALLINVSPAGATNPQAGFSFKTAYIKIGNWTFPYPLPVQLVQPTTIIIAVSLTLIILASSISSRPTDKRSPGKSITPYREYSYEEH